MSDRSQTVQMGRIAIFALAVILIIGRTGAVFSETAPVSISGIWKLESRNGPIPTCEFKQAGGNLTGSCTGPQAKGTITGTVFGQQVRWRWQWVTYAGNSSAGFDFTGTLGSDNVITGTVERSEIGFSQTFTATKIAQLSKNTQAQSPGQPQVYQIPMQIEGGTYVVPVLINQAITLNFTVDSGAADVNIPADVVITLKRTGTLKDSDFLGEKTYVLADGSKVHLQTFRIKSLKVGNKVLENVLGSVASVKGSLLLGQSFLGRFKSWSIDNTKHGLVFE